MAPSLRDNMTLEVTRTAIVSHYYDPVTVAVTGTLRLVDVVVLAATAAMGFGASVAVFQRRDIPG